MRRLVTRMGQSNCRGVMRRLALPGLVMLGAALRDLNGNGQPDEGEVKTEFDRFRLRCA